MSGKGFDEQAAGAVDPTVDVTGRSARAAAAALHRHRMHLGDWRGGQHGEAPCDCLQLAMVALGAVAATLEAYYLARMARDAGVDPPPYGPGAARGALRPAPQPRRPQRRDRA